MEGSEGMVAVVRGLKDAGLAVTLLDSGRQYTLLPDAVIHPVIPRANTNHTTASQCTSEHVAYRRESAVQATDGRYASTYKMMHCHMVPTSPPDLVTEFPPQKADLCPGHENFEIGGAGSGETYCHPTRCNSFRGGMCWPDRGSVFTPKPSIQQDSFTSSLRRYPNIAQERSSEIVERLISFTQAKCAQKKHRCNVPPSCNIDSDMSNQTFNFEAASSRNAVHAKCPPSRLEESPTREKTRRSSIDPESTEPWRKSTFCRTNDVRYLRDVSKRVRDGIRSLAHHPNQQPERLNSKDKSYLNATDTGKAAQTSSNSVNMEIQAAVQMVSREVVTAPLPMPSQRTIAVPLTPSPSLVERSSDVTPMPGLESITQIARQQLDPVTANIHPAISAIDLGERKHRKYKRSKSQDEIRIMQNEIVDVMQDLRVDSCCPKFHRRSHNRINGSNKFCNHMLGLTATNKCKDLKKCRSYARIFHAEVKPYRISDEENLAEILEDWLDLLPLKPDECFGRTIDKEFMFYDFLDCVKYFICNPIESSRKHKLKSDILDRLEILPIEIKGNRRTILSRLADMLINKVNNIGRRITTSTDNNHICNFENFITPTESELKIFVSAELLLYLQKYSSKINRRKIKELEDDLVEFLMFYIDETRIGNDEGAKRSVAKLLVYYGFSEYQSICFATILLTHLKESFIHNTAAVKVRSETFIVLPHIQNNSRRLTRNNSKITIKNKKDEIKLSNYNNEICKQIDEWLTSLKLEISESKKNGFKQEIINNLAADIIDRHKYLEFNPTSKGSDETELDYLKYQIFKWINKLVGEDNLIPAEHADDLMTRIKELSTPIFLSSCDVNTNNSAQAKNESNRLNENQQYKTCENSTSDFKIKLAGDSDFTHKYYTNGQCKHKSILCNSNCTNKISNTNLGARSSKKTIIIGNTDPKISKTASCHDIYEASQSVKSIEQLETEYDQFVKDWVQQIPIETSNSEEEAIAEKARLGIYNGLWKSISKLNCDPATYYNRFFYEDLLEDAIDELLDCLPQSLELISKRHLLKVKLIEKTCDVNDDIKANEEASFKNKLVKILETNFRKYGLISNDFSNATKVHNEIHIIKIVEEYILFTRFKNDDKLISEVFKKKLFHHIESFIESLSLKNNYGVELKCSDITAYKNDIFNKLLKVPLPGEQVIKEEADDILLAMEIDQWYTNLPVLPNEYSLNPERRKNQLDILKKKIKEYHNIGTIESENILRTDISKFLEKTFMKDIENLNVNLMIEELLNRIKNLNKPDSTQNTKRVVFLAPQSYEEFGKDIPYSSSLIQARPSYQNILSVSETNLSNNKSSVQTSKCNRGCGESQLVNKLKSKSSLNVNSISEPERNNQMPDFIQEEIPVGVSRKDSSNQWYTLEESQYPTTRQNTPMGLQQNFVDITQECKEMQKDININNRNESNATLHNYQNDILVKNQSQPYTENRRTNSNVEKTSSIQHNSQGTKKNIGILENSQVAGPSGFRPSNSENYPGSSQVNQSTEPFIVAQSKPSIENLDQADLQKKYSKVAEGVENQSVSPSIACQAIEADELHENLQNDCSYDAQHVSVATNTSGETWFSGQPIFASTKQKLSQSNTEYPSKKRPKWLLSEKDPIKSRNDTDDEEDNLQWQRMPRCHCKDKYWKCRRRPKYLSCEEFDDYLPYLPVLFPYPCFL